MGGNPLYWVDPFGLDVVTVEGPFGVPVPVVTPNGGYDWKQPLVTESDRNAVKGVVGSILCGKYHIMCNEDGNESTSDKPQNCPTHNSGDDKHPSTPTGRRGNPLDVKPGTNTPTKIGDRDYTGHSQDRMQGRGVPPSAVEDAILNGQSSPGNRPGTTVHVGQNGVTVVTGENGQVITVIAR